MKPVNAPAYFDAPATPVSPDVETLIIGTGFAGLCMAIQLQKAGRHSFMLLEKAEEVGGTWRENTYPGCACDVPSHLYSFSFEPNPDWSRMYSPQPEIQRYIRHCTEKYGLRPYIRFNTEMKRCEFDSASALWHVHTGSGEVITARYLVSGMGPLHKPVYPKGAGLETFEGKSFHSAHWDHDYELTGKRVAVIGTGASAIQFVPQIAGKVEELHLFQRTPPWVLPKADRDMKPWEKKLFKALPFLQRLFRSQIYLRMESRALGFTVNPKLMNKIAEMGRKYIASQIDDPALREKLTPDYMPGCKRLLISNDYYAALNRANVTVETDGVAEIRAHSILTKDGREIEVDAIIFGTGFEAADPINPGQFIGAAGEDLHAHWEKDGAQAYYGISVSGYPNLFFLSGPNTGLGHNSIIFMIEAQVNYILQCLDETQKRGADMLDVRQNVQDTFNEKLQKEIKTTVWSSGCTSWYQREDGKNTTLWPSFTMRYWHETRRLHANDYAFGKVPEKVMLAAD